MSEPALNAAPRRGARRPPAASASTLRTPAGNTRALAGLLPFLRPYRGRIALAVLFLVMAAVSTLVFPVALKSLIDDGLVAADPGERLLAMREHFLALFAVGAALGIFSAARFYMVSWLGERITADLRNAVYAACGHAEPGVLRDHADRRGAVAPDHRHHAGADRRRIEPEHGPAQHGDVDRRDG